MVRDTGFEPVTPSVSRKCSTTELTALPESKDNERESLIFTVFREFCEGQNYCLLPLRASQNPDGSKLS